MHTCMVCFKHFSNENALKTHLLIHSDGELFTCDICSRGFNDESTLKTHCLIHTDEKLHTCDICQRNFDQRITLKMHYLTHPKPYKCFMCFKAFALESHLQNHLLSHSNQNSPFQYNSECFPTIKEPKSQKLTHKYESVLHNGHEKNLRKDILKKIKKKLRPDKSKALRCSICNQEFMEYIQLKSHFDLHVSDSDFFCERCGVIFTERHEYDLHIKYHDDVTITFLCEFCKESFRTLADLKKHETKHKTSNVLDDHISSLCKFCEESFPTIEELKKHETKHKTSDGFAVVTFLCEFCKESFPTIEELKKHQTKHKSSDGLAIVTFLCEFCKESFPTIEELKKHETKHKTSYGLAVVTFLCEFCKESFPTIEELKKHETKHKISNDIADENTESNTSITDNRETEPDDSIMICEKCGDVFCNNYDFSNHLSLHKLSNDPDGENPDYRDNSNFTDNCETESDYCIMMCEKCGDVFFSNCDFTSHLFLHKLSDEHDGENPNCSDNLRLCEKCGDVFDDENKFINHVFSHIKLCEKCGGIFNSEVFFSNHVPSHL